MFESSLYDQKFRSYESICQPLDYNLIVYNMTTTLQILCKAVSSSNFCFYLPFERKSSKDFKNI